MDADAAEYLLILYCVVLCRRRQTEKSLAGQWSAVSSSSDSQHHCITAIYGTVTQLPH